jgi:hypothetical protein
MRVLLTNNTLAEPAGSELYVLDLAVELIRRGHQPMAYSTTLGTVAGMLRAAGVPVVDRLDSLGVPPDIIHGHHHYETQTALLRFPNIPAIYYCHGWTPWQEAPLHSPQIKRYVAVDELCRERLISEGGVVPNDIELLLNFFDDHRFPPRASLPVRPRLALAFGHYFGEGAGLSCIREACSRLGMDLHCAGVESKQTELNPGPRLAGYDVVFAKARSAIEAMAVGTAVILCGYGKLGPMVTMDNFSWLRRFNFGFRTLSNPLDTERVMVELESYDSADAASVSTIARRECAMKPAVDRLLTLYAEVIEIGKGNSGEPESAKYEIVNQRQPVPITETCSDAARYLERWAPRYKNGAELVGQLEASSNRCSELQGLLTERDTQLRSAEAELALRMVREAEQALRDELADAQARRSELEHLLEERCQQLRDAETERVHLLKGIEEARHWQVEYSALAVENRSLATRLSAAEEARQVCHYQMARLTSTLEAATSENNAIKSSATWRWSRRFFEHPLVAILIDPVVKAVARRAGTKTGSVRDTPHSR